MSRFPDSIFFPLLKNFLQAKVLFSIHLCPTQRGESTKRVFLLSNSPVVDTYLPTSRKKSEGNISLQYVMVRISRSGSTGILRK